ncbi:elongation factor P-like protein YeiP [Cycloclasticus zancles]|uniref:Elongation factor P-like protein n=1 Tax=Cycloclasticus zancles 78-ME TaxID=1198232 RepID=S5TUD5_9GAMM|nr:elongation factor P-like protein YeiP [Cycloclasticus zancles]AGS38630.1 Translation elongation factor P (EF-P) [Cycloclasticus zancles 78-ME]
MPKASDLKCGMVVEVNDEPYAVKSIDVRNPSSRGASTLYKVRFNHLKSKQKRDETLKGDDFLKDLDCEKANLQFSYQDGNAYTFMNLDTYDQYTLDAEDIEEQVKYLSEGLDSLVGILLEETLVAIELPATISLQIVDTAPGLKGASASARTKPATLSTGLEVQVPEYIDNEEVIKINTSTGKFMSRG